VKFKEKKKEGNDSSRAEALSIKERVEAADYAMKVKGARPEDEDISDDIGEVYGG
jgi:hypothetical protein